MCTSRAPLLRKHVINCQTRTETGLLLMVNWRIKCAATVNRYPWYSPVLSCPVTHNVAIHEWTWLEKINATLQEVCNHLSSLQSYSLLMCGWPSLTVKNSLSGRAAKHFHELPMFSLIGKLLIAVFQRFLQGIMRLEWALSQWNPELQESRWLRSQGAHADYMKCASWTPRWSCSFSWNLESSAHSTTMCLYICRRPEYKAAVWRKCIFPC